MTDPDQTDPDQIVPGQTEAPDEGGEPSPEDPTRFPLVPEVSPLDEAPDGQTPSDPDESTSSDSLPPGASAG